MRELSAQNKLYFLEMNISNTVDTAILDFIQDEKLSNNNYVLFKTMKKNILKHLLHKMELEENV